MCSASSCSPVEALPSLMSCLQLARLFLSKEVLMKRIRLLKSDMFELSPGHCFVPHIFPPPRSSPLCSSMEAQPCMWKSSERNENVPHPHLELFRNGGAELQRSSSRDSLIQFALIEAAQAN